MRDRSGDSARRFFDIRITDGSKYGKFLSERMSSPYPAPAFFLVMSLWYMLFHDMPIWIALPTIRLETDISWLRKWNPWFMLPFLWHVESDCETDQPWPPVFHVFAIMIQELAFQSSFAWNRNNCYSYLNSLVVKLLQSRLYMYA